MSEVEKSGLSRRAVMALYDVDSVDELHEIISSLPLFPWMDVEITALSNHALDPEGSAR